MSEEKKTKKPEKKPSKYVVAKGKTITSKKGRLVAGAEVKAAYFPGGETTMEQLFKDNIIVAGK